MNDFGDQPSLDDIARSDAFLDALAGGRQAAATDDTDAMLAAMLGDWRDELRWPPESELISEDAAFAAIQSGVARTGSRNPGSRNPGSRNTGRGRRHLGVVGAAAAAVLCLGGFGAVVAGSGPGDALYGLRSMLFGAPKQVRDDQVALAAQAELYQVQQMIARGDWQQAQDRLVAVSDTVAAIGDQQQKQELFNQWNQLSARVVERNPEATVPPGITYTVLPSVNQLVPTAAPTTLPSMPPITLAIPSEESPSEPVVSATGSPSPNPSTTELPAATSSVPTDLPSTSAPTSPVQETPQASTSAAAPTSASPATSAPASSAATSAPATSVPATSATATSVPATSAPATSAPATSAQQPSAASSEPATTAAPASSTVANSATATTAVPAPSPTQSAASATPSAQQTKQPTPTIVTTTAAGS